MSRRDRPHRKFNHLIRIAAEISLALFAIASASFAFSEARRVDPLPISQAFTLQAEYNPPLLQLRYTMPAGMYLYKKGLTLSVLADDIEAAELAYPEPMTLDDPFFGLTEIYYSPVQLAISLTSTGDDPYPAQLQVVAYFQGCDEQVGICYPPAKNTLALSANDEGNLFAAAADFPINAGSDSGDILSRIKTVTYDDSIVVDLLYGSNFPLALVLFFIAGVLLSFTPCVLPMISILLAILGMHDRSRLAALTVCYIMGIAFSLALLGVASGLLGLYFSAILQTPAFFILTALFIVILSGSLFGIYEFTLPSSWLAMLQNIGHGKKYSGAFAMGAVSSIVLSPCIVAPIAGALLYISQTGNAIIGGTLLFALALGMGVLLLFVGLGFGKINTHAMSGTMHLAKHIIGLLMLASAVNIIAPLLPTGLQISLYALIFITIGVLLCLHVGSALRRAAGVAIVAWGLVLFVGAHHGVRSIWAPLNYIDETASVVAKPLSFTEVDSLPALQRQLQSAGNAPVMLEFYADWCISCREMEALTFREKNVYDRLAGFTLLRVDITDYTEEHAALLKQFNIVGPPALILFSREKTKRVIGFLGASDFLNVLDDLQTDA